MNKIIPFIFRKYPFRNISLISILIISICIGVFILVTEPFGFINYKKNKLFAAIGFTIVTFISLIIIRFLKDKLIRKIIKKWTIIKEISYLNFVILIISIGNLLYLSFILENFSLTFSNFFYTLFLTFSLGFFPISFITVLKYNEIKNNNLGLIINDTINSNNDSNKFIKFKSLNKTEKELILNKENFLFVESIKNNIHVFFYEDDIVKIKSLRNTLKNIENQIQDEAIFRCHRSFIVNTNNIKTAKGNSNNYKIYFNHYKYFVPVSRNYTKSFRDLIY